MTGRTRIATITALAAVLLWVAQPAARAAPKPVYPGVETIKLQTPTDGVGTHPILRWKAVKGVTTYAVVVQTQKGDPYWTGHTTETKLRFGGGPTDAPKKRTEGAALTKKQQWFVLGYDDAGTVIASSAKRKIAP